jgi:hypothetical protein
MPESQIPVALLGGLGWHASAAPKLEIVGDRRCTGISDSKRKPRERQGEHICESELIRGALVIQVGSEPAFDGAQFQAFAALIIEHLIASDLAHGKVTRLWMRKI